MTIEEVTAAAGLDRTGLGERVRQAWTAWALEQPDPKPSWLKPFRQLTQPEQEVDMRIGEAIAELLSPERMLRAMHRHFRLHDGWIPDAPTADLPAGLLRARWEMISEEVNIELYRAMEAGDLVGMADAICDAVVALVGTAIVLGLPFDVLFREVMRSNMTKTSVPGEPKLVKGPGYQRPRVAQVLGVPASVS